MENTFINDLYNVIYTGISNNVSEEIDDIRVKLDSPQIEEFISLFVKLKLKNNVFIFF